jgi:HEAT repeat protein
MRWRLVCGMIIIILIVVGGLCALLFQPDVGTYEGKPLSFWLAEMDYSVPESRERREAAAKALRAMGPRIIPKLLDDLDPHESFWQRWRRLLAQKQKVVKVQVTSLDTRMRRASWAFEALGTNAAPAVPEIVKRLDGAPGYAPNALVGVREPALPAIQLALSHTNRYVRGNLGVDLSNAIEAERFPREPARVLIPALLRNLKDTNPSVRWNTASALGSIHLEPALCVPALIDGLSDPDPEVQTRCGQALSRFGDDAAEALPAILALYESARSDRRQTLCNSVKHFRSAPNLVVPFLVRALSDADPPVRMFAASSLGQLGQLPELAIPPLTNALQDVNEFVRVNAAQAIGNLVENSDNSTEITPAESLARRTKFAETCIPVLANALQDPHDFVRLSAATSIGKFQASGSNAIPALLNALNDSSASVRGNTTNALNRIAPRMLRRPKK